MSLSKQLSLSLACILLLVFAGTLWINVNNTRDFINLQLESHAQDTATSLGLSISPYLGESADLPIVDTMLNAIFDRGYYQSITLLDSEGKLLLEKHSDKTLDAVPQWFVSLFPLAPPKSQTEINDGWSIAGTMTIVSDPGIGYMQLWHSSVQLFWMVSGIFILALVLVWALLKVITTPLLAVVNQAKAISKKQFDTVKDIPKTPELRIFVEAINTMSNQLAKMFSQITDQAERYRQFAYTDGLTGKGNRRAFELFMGRLLTDEEHRSHGYLALVRLTSLAQVNAEFGFASGDAYIKSVIELIDNMVATNPSQISVYRLNGADFAIVLEDTDKATVTATLHGLISAFNGIEKSEFKLGTAHVGVAEFAFENAYSVVLEQADSALAVASMANEKLQFASGIEVSQGNELWRDQLQTLIAKGQVEFVAQPLKSFSQTIIYREWFARFKQSDKDEYFPMAQLIPASIRLDFSEKLDRLVLQNVFSQIANTSHAIGLNVSRLSLSNPEFRTWFLKNLPQDSAQCARLVLEIPERALVNDFENLYLFVQSIREQGIRVCVEHFGAQLAAFTHLRKIQPDFLKIDGRFTRNIQNEQDNQLFVQSLVSIAHGLNIKVISEMVETEAEAECLKSLSVDYLQGYFVGKPVELV